MSTWRPASGRVSGVKVWDVIFFFFSFILREVVSIDILA